MTPSPMPDAAAAMVTDRIRAATREHHQRAEHAEFQQRLVAGKHGPAPYAAWLGQMRLLHEALERLEQEGVRAAGRTTWPITNAQHRTASIAADLLVIGSESSEVTPLPAARAFIAQCEAWAADPVEAWKLLGAWYVLEGATNGGRYIARNVRRGAGLAGVDGTRYLDPYGEEQPQRWQAFKEAFNAAVPAAHAETVLDGACATYDAVTALGEELSAAFPA